MAATVPVRCELAGAGGIRLVADRIGDETGPTVLLLHGGGQTRHSWGGTARALADRGWCAVTLDFRGHGESDWHPDGDYSLRSFAHDVTSVIAQLGGRVYLVGASLGGLTTMFLEGEFAPGTAPAVVLVDIVPEMDTTGTDRISNFMRERMHTGFSSLEEARDAVAAYNSHRPPPKDLDGLKKNLRLGEDGRWRWHWDPQFVDRGDKGLSEVRDVARMRQACRNMTIPVLLVRGRMSDVVTLEGVRSFMEDVPHAEYVDVSGAGHMVVGDRNDYFTDAVVEFLDRQR